VNQRVEVIMDCRPESVAIGRHFVSDALRLWGVGEADPAREVVSDVLLVVSELLANAVRTGSGRISMTLEARSDHLAIGVRDGSPRPAIEQPPDAGAPSGRGLALVAALSERWGQSPHDGASKEVWAEFGFGPDSLLPGGEGR
jgi:anti-sigma regulatory factor (Ser/Thr protein kinase)